MKDRKALIEHDIHELKRSLSNLYLLIAVEDYQEFQAAYDDQQSKLAIRETELKQINEILEADSVLYKGEN